MKLLTKKDIAAMFGTTSGIAASILEEHGVSPIDFGYGRSRGKRWLNSAVEAVLITLHNKANPTIKYKKNAHRLRPQTPHISLASMSVDEVYALTKCANVQ